MNLQLDSKSDRLNEKLAVPNSGSLLRRIGKRSPREETNDPEHKSQHIRKEHITNVDESCKK